MPSCVPSRASAVSVSPAITLRQPPRDINADRKRCCAVSLSTIMTVRVSCVFAIFSVPPPSHNDASAHLCRLSLSCRDLRHRGKRAIKGNGISAAGERSKALEHRSEEHTSELQSLMRISYAVFCLKKKTT